MDQLPSTPMGALRFMPSTAQEVGRFAKGIIEAVQNGDANPIEVLVLLRSLEAVSETVRDSIKGNIENAADKYSEKTFEVFGAKVEKADFGKYDYSGCGDKEWELFNTAEESAASSRKEREAFLRTLKEPMDVLDKETGETWTIRPPLKKSNMGLRVYLK